MNYSVSQQPSTMGDCEQHLTETVLQWPSDDFASARNSYSTTLGTSDTITLDLSHDTITFDSILSNMSQGAPTPIWTTTGVTDSVIPNKIRLEGANADIEINGVGLWATMQEISNRLNIMHVNPELETQWAELRELGEQYRKLEQHIIDKQATFDRIRAMPAPDVD